MHGGAPVDPSIFLINVAVILIFTKVGGMISKRFGVPSVLGQVLIGVILGPSILGILRPDIFLDEVGQIGVIFLMFLAGLDTEVESMKSIGKQSLLIAAGGVVFPLLFGTAVAYLFKPDFHVALFVGTILTATSVSITVQTLLELGKLRSIEGNAILTAAVIDDIIGILILAMVVGVGSNMSLLQLAGMILLFFVGIIIFGRFIFPLLIDLHSKYEIKEGRVTLAIACCLLFAWLADKMGVATIIGAYIMGMFVGQTKIKKLVTERISVIAYTFFIPIFFISIGAGADLHQINATSLLFVIAIVLTAILAKIFGSVVGAILGKFSLRSAYRVGVGMIARGEVALIITSLGLRKGIIDNDVFSSTLILVLVTTILTPILLSKAFKEPVEAES
jgi:Kef-type K+ transport system membrane component KefB